MVATREAERAVARVAGRAAAMVEAREAVRVEVKEWVEVVAMARVRAVREGAVVGMPSTLQGATLSRWTGRAKSR